LGKGESGELVSVTLFTLGAGMAFWDGGDEIRTMLLFLGKVIIWGLEFLTCVDIHISTHEMNSEAVLACGLHKKSLEIFHNKYAISYYLPISSQLTSTP
jgi:hypothetical protein